MIFTENKKIMNRLLRENLDTLNSELVEGCIISSEINKKISTINEDFLTNGIYNYIKYQNIKFLKESYQDYNLSMVKLLSFTKNKVKQMYTNTIETLKIFNKDIKLTDTIIGLLNKKDTLNIEIKNEIEDYNYTIPKDLSYYKKFDKFILGIKTEYMGDITDSLVEKLRKKYTTEYFNKFRASLIDSSTGIDSENFPESLYKYFRSGELEPKYLAINSETVLKNIETFKDINKCIQLLSNEYGYINKFYSEIESMINAQSDLFSHVKVSDKKKDEDLDIDYYKIKPDNDKIYIDYVTLRNSHFNQMVAIYSIYFVERLIAIKQMYKSYYNQCALYYSKIKYRSE